MWGKVKLYVIGGLAMATAVLYALWQRSKRVTAKIKLNIVKGARKASDEHQANDIYAQREGQAQEKKDVENLSNRNHFNDTK